MTRILISALLTIYIGSTVILSVNEINDRLQDHYTARLAASVHQMPVIAMGE